MEELFNELTEEKDNVYNFLLNCRQGNRILDDKIQVSFLNIQHCIEELEKIEDDTARILATSSKSHFSFLINQILKEI